MKADNDLFKRYRLGDRVEVDDREGCGVPRWVPGRVVGKNAAGWLGVRRDDGEEGVFRPAGGGRRLWAIGRGAHAQIRHLYVPGDRVELNGSYDNWRGTVERIDGTVLYVRRDDRIDGRELWTIRSYHQGLTPERLPQISVAQKNPEYRYRPPATYQHQQPATSYSCPPGTKYDGDKADWSLVQWRAMEAYVRVLTFGAKKYDRDNWRKVPNLQYRYLAAAMRHVAAYARGERKDPESGEHPLAHVVCCFMFMLEDILTKEGGQ